MAEFSVEIKSYEGIKAIKKILQSGVDAAKKQNYDVKVSIIGAPKYTCYVETPTKDSGKEALTIILDEMRKVAAEMRGDFKVDREVILC
jgi:translation initiation factor 2 alpha subunit (eIF-2alpha)